MRGVSVTAAWYHRDSYNMTQSVNGPFTPADYAVVNVVSPIDGTLIPAYNLNSAKQGQVDRVDVNATDGNLRGFTYTGFEFGAAARMGRVTLFGGWTIDRTIMDHCDELENWGNLSGVYYDASGNNSLQPKSDYAFCNQSQQGLPYLHEFKLSGSYQLPWEIQVNAALQSYSGPQLATRWNIGRTTRYSSNCLAPCVPGALVIPNMTPANYILDLTAPGTQYYDRLNQLDLGFRKIFRVGRYQFSGQADFFNFLNAGYVKSQVVNHDFSNAANVDASSHDRSGVRHGDGDAAAPHDAARDADAVLKDGGYAPRDPLRRSRGPHRPAPLRRGAPCAPCPPGSWVRAARVQARASCFVSLIPAPPRPSCLSRPPASPIHVASPPRRC